MSISDVLTIVVAAALTGVMGWYFFGPKKYRTAEIDDGVQVVKVTVKGGYSPDVIQVVPGVPVRLLFDRQESGDCSSRVVFADFKVNQTLPAFETTAVEFLPEVAGEYAFACWPQRPSSRAGSRRTPADWPPTARRRCSSPLAVAPPRSLTTPACQLPTRWWT